MGTGKVQRRFPGELEEPDSDEARRRQDRGSRKAEEDCSGCRFDGRAEAESGANGRQEKARGNYSSCRGASTKACQAIAGFELTTFYPRNASYLQLDLVCLAGALRRKPLE